MIVQADARHIPLADGSVQCVVTSPPYWGLRDYGVTGQIGLEPTPEAYVATMVQVFREVRRVLRDDGTLWLNLGDSYASGELGRHDKKIGQRMDEAYCEGKEFGRPRQQQRLNSGLKPKDLCGMPWRVAFALQADGWYLRSDIIWAKPNPMPESVTDRPTRSHEYLFLLAKSERYFYDADAIREAAEYGRRDTAGQWRGGAYVNQKGAQNNSNGNGGFNSVTGKHPETGRNKRDVWTVNSEPTPEAHFATFPQRLIEPCILAGTSEKGCCAKCGAPRVRRLGEASGGTIGKSWHDHSADGVTGNFKTASSKGYQSAPTLGWQPSCAHDAPSIPCIVLDIFLGSGTVGKVCERLGRRWAGLELSRDYISIARKRTSQLGLFSGGSSVD